MLAKEEKLPVWVTGETQIYSNPAPNISVKPDNPFQIQLSDFKFIPTAFQMHELANIFGDMMILGYDPPFETIVRIAVRDLKNLPTGG